MVGLIGLCYWLMRRGWNRQAELQTQIPAPRPVGSSTPTFHGTYASTTLTNQPLTRVVVHGLGARSSVEVGVSSEAIDIHRIGSTSFSIPRRDVLSVAKASGIAGKFVGDNSLTVITWKLGDVTVDTGLHIRERDFAKEISA